MLHSAPYPSRNCEISHASHSTGDLPAGGASAYVGQYFSGTSLGGGCQTFSDLTVPALMECLHLIDPKRSSRALSGQSATVWLSVIVMRWCGFDTIHDKMLFYHITLLA